MIGYHAKLARVLDAMGGLYTLDDILTAIGENRMQSFAVNNSWAITQVSQFPRVRRLQVVAAVGDLPDMAELHSRIFDYAKRNNVDLVSAYGRYGWTPTADDLGWRLKAKSYLYQKRVTG